MLFMKLNVQTVTALREYIQFAGAGMCAFAGKRPHRIILQGCGIIVIFGTDHMHGEDRLIDAQDVFFGRKTPFMTFTDGGQGSLSLFIFGATCFFLIPFRLLNGSGRWRTCFRMIRTAYTTESARRPAPLKNSPYSNPFMKKSRRSQKGLP
jgi:hypothetical protein